MIGKGVSVPKVKDGRGASPNVGGANGGPGQALMTPKQRTTTATPPSYQNVPGPGFSNIYFGTDNCINCFFQHYWMWIHPSRNPLHYGIPTDHTILFQLRH